MHFEDFMEVLKETNVSLKDYVDFPKIEANVEAISIKLNQLNYLIGQTNMPRAVNRLWEENPKVFSILGILIAVRSKDKKKALDANGNVHLIEDYFQSPEHIIRFLNETGLTKLFQTRQITNLVDYVFGVEVGLDSNARKNRGGHIMEGIISNIFSLNGIPFEREVYYTEFTEIEKALGTDKKRFDFVVRTPNRVYLIETNFYTGGGSKLNEVARSYSDLALKINSIPGYEFVWITDGIGWKEAKSKFQEAFSHIPSIYNLTNIQNFIKKIKND